MRVTVDKEALDALISCADEMRKSIAEDYPEKCPESHREFAGLVRALEISGE